MLGGAGGGGWLTCDAVERSCAQPCGVVVVVVVGSDEIAVTLSMTICVERREVAG